MEQNAQAPLFELQIDNQVSAHLADAARWGKFLSIVGFIYCGFIAIAGIFASTMMTFFMRMNPAMPAETEGIVGMVGVFYSIIFILLAVVYFFPCLFLYNFSNKMKVALRNNDQEQLTNSFRNLKACLRFIGVLTIIGLSIFALLLIFGAIGAAFAPHY